MIPAHRKRIIPVLLLMEDGLYKTTNFKNPVYLGDPFNAAKIFNDKEVDELVVLDILASKRKRRPQFELLRALASECFMPLSYGGGISMLSDIQKLNNCGIEKVIINSAARDIDFISSAAAHFGTSTIVASVDVGLDWRNRKTLYTHGGTKKWTNSLEHTFSLLAQAGAGELLVNTIYNDGRMLGYDLDLISLAAKAVSIPVIACGGAGRIEDFELAIKAGASAVAAGSFFVFYGPLKAVLITFPAPERINHIV